VPLLRAVEALLATRPAATRQVRWWEPVRRVLRARKVLCWKPVSYGVVSRQDALLGAGKTYWYELARCAAGLGPGQLFWGCSTGWGSGREEEHGEVTGRPALLLWLAGCCYGDITLFSDVLGCLNFASGSYISGRME
jgi:hypothetical protein